MTFWALQLLAEDRAYAAAWRLAAEVEVHDAGATLWLRGRESDTSSALLDRMPVGWRFRVLADGQLIPHRAQVPHGHLPTGSWQPLRSWLQLELPTAQFAPPAPSKTCLTLVRDAAPRTPNLLITTVAAWERYASSAPIVRLAPLRFAAAADGRILIHGTPLPSMPGEFYCESDGIAVPAGWYWSPPVDAAVLRSVLGLAEKELALLARDNTWERITADNFVQATRAAARATAEGARA